MIFYYSNYDSLEAIINCYDGRLDAGSIRFCSDDVPVPSNDISASGYPTLNYPISKFNDIISILRYEKPLYLHLTRDTLIGIIATDEQEPVGEEESRSA